jgi:sulfotransferase
MTKRFYFMAGLPRSGSTLLSSILSQNPNIHSGPSSPIAACMHSVDDLLQKDELYRAFPKPEQAKLMINNLITQYYSDIDKPVVIDKNRAWPAHVPLIENNLQQKAKIICPVRDIDEILASMISMIRRNPYIAGGSRSNFIDEPLIKQNIPINDENRCHFIAGPKGILGNSLRSIVDGARAGFLDRMLFVEYKDLIKDPKQALQGIYEFLGEPNFNHDFDNIENNNKENDLEIYGLEDMHKVRKVLKATASNPKDILPPLVIERCKGMDVWRRPEALVAINK